MMFLLPWVLFVYVIIVLQECLLSIAILPCTTPSITTTVPPDFFSVQTGDLDTSCSFNDDCKEEETICTIKEPLPEVIRPTQECQIYKVCLCKNQRDLFHAK